MLLYIFTASVLSWPGISAVPTQTPYANLTIPGSPVTSSASSNTSSCPVSCEYLPIARSSQYWSKYVTVETLATVVVVINDSNNTTETVTNYVQSLLINGTAPTNSLPPRTDTNAAGTVTQQIELLDGSSAIFTYPTPYYGVASTYRFSGVLPYSSRDLTTCISNDGPYLSLPSHTPWSTSIGSVDPEDKLGLFYTMQEDYNLSPFSADWVATQFPGELIDGVFQSCTVPLTPAPATWVREVSYLTVTSTAHVSGPITTLPPASSPGIRPAETALLRSLVHPASEPDPQDPPNPSMDPEPATAFDPVISSLPDAVSPPSSGLRELPSNGLDRVADSSSVPVANGQQSVSDIVVDIHTQQVASSLQTSAVSVPRVTYASQTYPAGPEFTSGYVIGTQTLVPGGPPISISGNQISLPSEAAPQASDVPVAVVLVSGDPLATAPDTQSQTGNVGIGSYIISGLGGSMPATSFHPTSQNSASLYVFGTQTLTPGGPPITVSGTEISLASGETQLVVGTGNGAQTETADIPGFITSGLSGSKAAITTDSGLPDSASTYVIGGQTLIPGGPAITASGTRISLASNGREIIIGTGGEIQTKTTAIGGYIVSSLDGSALATSSGLNPSRNSTAEISTGSTTRDGNTASTSGGRTTMSSNLPATTGAAHLSRPVRLQAWQILAAVWCIWVFHHV